jgi:hypothetical protein
MRKMCTALCSLICVGVFASSAFGGPSIAGSFQGWNPADPAMDLTLNANGVYELTLGLPAGTHQYKVVETDDWTQSFPTNNQSFTLADSGNVTFYVNLGANVGTADGDEYVFHSPNPPIVCGDFMSELGGSDWDQTDTLTTVMSDPDGDDIWSFKAVVPAGNYNFKVVLNNNWDQDTFPPAQNYAFSSNGTDTTRFMYNMSNNVTTVQSGAAPTVLWARPDYAQDNFTTTTLDVEFSENVEEITAETAGNYSVSGGITVSSATRMDPDSSRVRLSLSGSPVLGTGYTVTVLNVEDLDGNPIVNNGVTNVYCFEANAVIFQINMTLHLRSHPPAYDTLAIQGDTYPLNWDPCQGPMAHDDGLNYDTSAGDSIYTVGLVFPIGYDCAGMPETKQVKYKYIHDCSVPEWEGDFDFGHFVDIVPGMGIDTMFVWWNDEAPGDFTICPVGVLFQVTGFPTPPESLGINGGALPLDWSVPPLATSRMNDAGANGDTLSSDGTYSLRVLFPTNTYRFVNYKYIAYQDTAWVYECLGFPDRTITLDDVAHCDGLGDQIVLDLWDYCSPVSGIQRAVKVKSWGEIKTMYK